MPDLTPREIQQSVVERYGARARSVLASEGIAPADDACCAPAVDLSAPQPLSLSLDAPAGGLKTLGSLADL
ncbi:MAG: hypothetical protein O2822_09080, partial [Chloroflexi bacterium]|nr:hypothetical protein [Chloroflexota bacterium]